MIKQILLYILLFLLIFNIQSCSIFFEDDLDGATINLIAPADMIETENTTQTFMWTEVEGASGYNLMIVSPSFDSISAVLLDIDTLTTRYVFELKPGKYQWGVMAYNSSDNTPFFYNDLTILESDSTGGKADISNNTLNILAPTNSLQTKNAEITIWWEKVDSATAYQLAIVSPDFENIESVILDSTLTNNKYKRKLVPGKYQWSLFAFNDASETEKVMRSFTILPGDTLDEYQDLSDLAVNLTAPADDKEAETTSLTFIWDKVDSAKAYHVQIVSPDFNNIEKIILDSTLSDNNFTKTFSDGNYQWGVIAYNDFSETPMSVRTFMVNTENSLEGKMVILSSPSSDDAFNKSTISLEWLSISGADKYVVEVHKDTWEGENVVYPYTTSGNSFSVSLSEGTYTWGVKATNDFSESDYGTAGFMVDLTPPAKPSLSIPLNSGDTIKTSPFKIQWTHPSESLTDIYDSLFIAKDSLFSSGIQKFFLTGDLSYNLYDFQNGKWFCKVQSIDKAGNASKTSVTKSFYLLK